MSDAIAPFNPKFKVGDKVVFINDYGVNWGEKTVTEVVHNHVRGATYFITNDGTPWFDHSERNLFLPTDPAIKEKTICNGNHPFFN